MRLTILFFYVFLVTSCSQLFFYKKKDFTCEIHKNDLCESLYQINKKIDRGEYNLKH